jgi:hypothetical protein
VVESLSSGGAAFLDALKKRDELEEEQELRGTLTRLLDRLGNEVGGGQQAVTSPPGGEG